MADLVFIGKENGEYGEEMYINLSDEKLSGWSFMGLRPETEDKLIEQARDTEPEDMGLEKSQYFDMEAFRDDMESDAIERHDSQGEYERDGETYYLGFGSGQDIFGYFDKNGINELMISLATSMSIIFLFLSHLKMYYISKAININTAGGYICSN